MSKLKDLVGRGVRLIVTDVPGTSETTPAELPAEAFAEPPEPAPPPAATTSQVPADVDSFSAVYEEAGIALEAHGYGIDKVAEMLGSKHLASMAREVKAASVLAALEAASVPLKDVIQDAVRRDRALDAFEMAKGREVEELRKQGESRIAAIESEIQSFLKEKNAELEGLKRASEDAKQAFRKLQARKRQEEERLFDVVSHFVAGSENPVTTSGSRPTSPPPPTKPGPA
jgi:pimeloyl-ACP methyl ester carboxylesterase